MSSVHSIVHQATLLRCCNSCLLMIIPHNTRCMHCAGHCNVSGCGYRHCFMYWSCIIAFGVSSSVSKFLKLYVFAVDGHYYHIFLHEMPTCQQCIEFLYTRVLSILVFILFYSCFRLVLLVSPMSELLISAMQVLTSSR